MRIAIIIPAHNEERFIKQTIDSLLSQTHLPEKIIIVDDNSTDHTYKIASSYSSDRVTVIQNKSSDQNIPGSKVIRAFNKGLDLINLKEFDIVCKYDADLIFPQDYLERIVGRFRESEKIGMVAGHCLIEKKGEWIPENLTNPDHIRGALKAYITECFQKIDGLKASIGWDTIDEMLARYYDYRVVTISDLYVKHLKPTGSAYKAKSQELQGEAFYKMRYGKILTLITAMKMALSKKELNIVKDYMKGYKRAKKQNLDPLVTEDQGRYIRNYRWNGIKTKLGFE